MVDKVKPLFDGLFGINDHIKESTRNGAVQLYYHSKQLSVFLDSIGVPAKEKNQASIPKWITDNPAFLAACLRGLIDTDGSIHRLSKRDFRLLRISFKNNNRRLLEDVRQGFLQLGFHPSKIILNQMFLTRKADIALFHSKIGV